MKHKALRPLGPTGVQAAISCELPSKSEGSARECEAGREGIGDPKRQIYNLDELNGKLKSRMSSH